MKLVKSQPKPLAADPVELFSLDELVSDNETKKILYVRISGTAFCNIGISNKDILAVELDAKALPDDLVLCQINDLHTIKFYSEVRAFESPLRLISRDGKPVASDHSFESFKILGVVTHTLRAFNSSNRH